MEHKYKPKNRKEEHKYKPKNRKELESCIENEIYIVGKYNDFADLNCIDTSLITDMSELFAYNKFFKGDISLWNVSKVKNMRSMFYNSYFNGDISNWDVGKVKDMGYMFQRSKFNGDISRWNVSKVKDMGRMFFESIFNQDISNWNVSRVEDMDGIFDDSAFKENISKWDFTNLNNESLEYIHEWIENNNQHFIDKEMLETDLNSNLPKQTGRILKV